MVREGLVLYKRNLPASDPAVAAASFALGNVLQERGAYSDAVNILEEPVRTQSSRQEITPDLADGISALASAHYYLGHLTLADTLFERALAMERQIYGRVHPRVADDLLNLGEVQYGLGHYPQAEKDYREALAIKQSWYGKEHPDTAISMLSVGQSLYLQGPSRYDEAAGFMQGAVDIQSRVLGKMHPQIAQGLNVLGVLENKRGHLDAAEADFTRALDINRAAYGDRHYLVGIAWMNLAEVYFGRKKPTLAERGYREALGIFVEKLPAGHPNTAIAQVGLGHALVLEQRYREAEGLLLDAHDVFVKQPDAIKTRFLLKDRKDLVAVYAGLNQPDKAKKFQAELAAAA